MKFRSVEWQISDADAGDAPNVDAAIGVAVDAAVVEDVVGVAGAAAAAAAVCVHSHLLPCAFAGN